MATLNTSRATGMVSSPDFWMDSALAALGFAGSRLSEDFIRANAVDLDFRLSGVAYDVFTAVVVIMLLPMEFARPLALGVSADAATAIMSEIGVPIV